MGTDSLKFGMIDFIAKNIKDYYAILIFCNFHLVTKL